MPLTPLEDDPRVPLYYRYESAEDFCTHEFDGEDVDYREPYSTVMWIIARGEMDDRLSLMGVKATTNLLCEDNYEMYDIQKAVMKLVEFGVVTQHYEDNEVELRDGPRTRKVREKVN